MSLAKYNRVVQDASGNGVSGAHIEVRAEIAWQPLAALYSDRAGTIAIGNPFDAAADGSFGFHVVGGAYQIRVYTGPSGTPTFEKILRYEGIGKNSESDSIDDRTQRVYTDPGTYGMGADDADDIIIEKTVPEPTTFALVDPSLRTKSVKIVQGMSSPETNIITITVPSGKTLYGVLNGTTTLEGLGSSVELTPRRDGTGWY
jgi:hypothetical protein